MRRNPVLTTFGRTIAGLLVAASAAGCSATEATKSDFDSAEQAVDALIAALRANDSDKLHSILGSGADDVLDSGDEVADHNNLAAFLAGYDEDHKLVKSGEGETTLIVGKGEWPMPIPVVANGGRWSFDTEAGKDELLSRRIGRNELDAIQVCLATVDAEREYATEDRDGDGIQEYAAKFLSDPGQKNGLYWPTKEGEPQSPLGELVAEAEDHGYSAAKSATAGIHPYRGYCFKILTSQTGSAEGGEFDYIVNGQMIGGFAVVAYPAEYANSGIMTFIVSHAGVVYEKDLGEMTKETARAITKYGPGVGWEKVPQEKQ
jgi:hypothetical protein